MATTVFNTLNTVAPWNVPTNAVGIWPPHPSTSAAVTPAWKKYRTKEQKAMTHLLKESSRELPAVAEYFRSIHPDIVISHLGGLRPVHAGRPRKLVMNLLNAAASPVKGAFYLGHGLTYKVPHLAGRRKTRHRLTLSGLRLLEHYAAKWPCFRPFFAAYVTPKAKREIMRDTIDFEMNHVPKWISDRLAENIVLQEKIETKKIEALADYLRQKGRAHTYDALIKEEYERQIQAERNYSSMLLSQGRALIGSPYSNALANAASQNFMSNQMTNQMAMQNQVMAQQRHAQQRIDDLSGKFQGFTFHQDKDEIVATLGSKELRFPI